MSELLPARVVDLGTRAFDEVWAIQREMVAARQRDEIADTLILVEHPNVITLGRGTHRENIVAPGDMPMFEIERGGDVTYHGPGQLVGYPIFLLREHERDLRVYLRNLEQALIQTVAAFGLPAGRRESWTGVWNLSADRKLASIGVAVKRWVTLHGFALNVSTDLSRFAAINPCGLEAHVMASMSTLLDRPIALEEVKPVATRAMATVFRRNFLPAPAAV